MARLITLTNTQINYIRFDLNTGAVVVDYQVVDAATIPYETKQATFWPDALPAMPEGESPPEDWHVLPPSYSTIVADMKTTLQLQLDVAEGLTI